jgi:hypothetical protein
VIDATGEIVITADPTPYGDPSAGCGSRAGSHPLDWNVQGPAGPQGPVGPPGPAVAPAPATTDAGPLITAHTNFHTFLAAGKGFKSVLGLAVPAGRFLVIANVQATNGARGGVVRCRLIGAGIDATAARFGESSTTTLPLTAVMRGPGISKLQCRGGPGNAAGVDNRRMSALKVSTVEGD